MMQSLRVDQGLPPVVVIQAVVGGCVGTTLGRLRDAQIEFSQARLKLSLIFY